MLRSVIQQNLASQAGRLDLQWVAGDHESILTVPSVKNLAAAISATLAARQLS